MDVAILGENRINAYVEELLKSAGFNTGSEPQDPEPRFTPVIITEAPGYEAPVVGGEALINLMDEKAAGRLIDLKTEEKVAVLLDYPEETPEYIAAKAIGLAIKLANVKKEVVFLSKVVKSGYGGGEEAFSAARNAGVTFIKYDSLEVSYDEEKDVFVLEINDGVFPVKIETPYVLGAVVREVPGLKELLKKLRLYKKSNGDISDIGLNDDRFFLYPSFTSRFGVYYINPLHTEPGNEKELQEAVLQIISDIKAHTEDSWAPDIVRGLSYPEVDSGKCAFCYSCFRACAHGALEPDMESSAMKVAENLCQACGTCVAICPGEAIAFTENNSQSSRFISGSSRVFLPICGEKNANLQKHTGSEPQDTELCEKTTLCKIYLCENGAASAYEEALPLLGEYAGLVDTECVPCGGSVGADILAGDASAYDTLIIACCIEDACRHMDGDKRACRQAARAADSFNKANLTGKRAEIIQVSHVMKNVLRDRVVYTLEEKNEPAPEETSGEE